MPDDTRPPTLVARTASTAPSARGGELRARGVMDNMETKPLLPSGGVAKRIGGTLEGDEVILDARACEVTALVDEPIASLPRDEVERP